MYRNVLIPAALASIAASFPLSKRSINGPVMQQNFPDPSAILVDGTWYAYATNSGQANVPWATSTDFNTWDFQTSDVLPTVGSWTSGNVWAPNVLALPQGGYVLYYSGASVSDGSKHCVGAATGSSPSGPFTPVDDALACPLSQGGAIDPSGFVDSDGTIYVVYKIDGNSIGHGGNCGNSVAPIVPTPIMLQKMQADGVTPDGAPQQILDRGDADGPLVEAPSLVKVDETYFLFFSSNCYSGSQYDTSYAISRNGITNGGQDYTKVGAPNAPLLVTGTDNLYSPGGLAIAPDGQHVVFHADQGTTANTRLMYAGIVSIDSSAGTVTI